MWNPSVPEAGPIGRHYIAVLVAMFLSPCFSVHFEVSHHKQMIETQERKKKKHTDSRWFLT